MKNQTSFRIPLAGLVAAAMLFVGLDAGASIVGPYTADANTLHLWHLDEATTPAIDSVSSGGLNLAALLNGATLGNAGYAGFGTALNTASTGGGQKAALAAAASGNVTITVADTTTGAFTFEANVFIGFDPTVSATTAYEILAGESGANGNRIFQWRLVPMGFTLVAGVVAAQPYLTFENVRAVSGNQASIYAPIPTTGPDAIAMNTWYHVAVTYNGRPSTANNIKFYWTLLDGSRDAVNQIAITSAVNMLTGLNPLATVSTPFAVGNQARSYNGNFVGMIDEVRISNIERGPGDMMFVPTCPLIVSQPAGTYAALGDTVALSVGAAGMGIGYHWQLYGTNIPPEVNPTATNATLILANIDFGQAGPYQVVVANTNPTCVAATSDTATVTVGHLIAGTFNTGLSENGTLLASGQADPHWQLVQSDDPNYPVDPNNPPPAVVTTAIPGTYLAPGPNSGWIAPWEDIGTFGPAGGNYTYRTTFLLDTQDAAHATLYGNWAMDNAGVEIHLNGVTNTFATAGFASFTPFTLTNGFVPGLNTLECVITNYTAGATALRVELRGIATDLPSTAPSVTTAPVNVTTQAQQNASFSVVAVGSGPLTYQWYHDTTLLAGKTQRMLELTDLTPADAGTYTVYVTNSVSVASASASLTVTTPPALAWLGIDSSNPSFWDNGVTVNWLDTGSSANTVFGAYDNVVFDSRGSGTPNVNLAEPLSPNAVTVDATSDYTFSGPGSLVGNVILTKKNTGTLIVDTINSNSGPTVIEGGTLQLGNGDFSGTLGSSAISNNAALVFNRADLVRVPNSISGTGSVAATGPGVVYMSGYNTYTGPTTIASGSTISANSPTALGDISSGTTVADGGQLFIDQSVSVGAEPITLSGFGIPIAGSEGALRKGPGSAFTIFGGPITLAASAGIKVDANGTLNLTNAAGITGTNVSLAVQADSTGVRGTVAGPITLGMGDFTEYGAGTWVLLGTNNNWTGSTTISSPGVLQIGDGGTNGSLSGSTIQNDGTLTFLSAKDLLVTGAIAGGGALNQNGIGSLTLTAANSYSGTTTIRGSGVLRITDGSALGFGTCAIGAAQTDTCRLELLGGITVNNAITIFPRVWYQTPPPAPVVAPDILNVSGTNTLSPPSSIVIASGGNLLTLQSDSGKLILNSGVTSAGGGRHLALRGAAEGEIVGNIDRTGANSQFVWKLDSGTWTVLGAMSPGAATTISNGVLVLNGSLDNVLTNAGGTLSGTGVLSGPVYINLGATLSPGPGIGTMTIDNTLTLQPGSFTAMDINKTDGTSDQVVGLTNISYGGTLQVSLTGTPQIGDAFKLFDAASYSGAFASITPATPGAGLAWLTTTLTTDGTLRVQTANVSQPVLSSSVQNGTNLVMNGSNGTPGTGYSVISSTNLVLPSSAWEGVASGVFDSLGQFTATIVINPATPQRFFRIRAP